MNIMQINSSWGWSGGQNQVLILSEGLSQRGHSVVIVTPPKSELSRRARDKGLQVEEVYMKKEYNLGAVWKMKKLMESYGTEVANAHKPLPFSLGSLAASMAHVPVFVVSRRVSFPVGRNIFSAWKWKHYKIDGIIAVSKQIRRGLIKFGFDEKLIEVIYSGTDTSQYHPGIDGSGIRREFGAGPGTRIVTKLANYFEWKGYAVFLEAAAMVLDQQPDTIFLCVGHPNDFLPTMKQIATRLGITDKVFFTGFRRDVQEIIAASAVTVNCAIKGEGLAGVLRESLCMEVPVVSSDAGGNGELVSDNVTGRLVAAGDVKATADAILSVFRDPVSASIMARQGRDRVLRDFTNDAMIEKTEAFYRKLLAGVKKTRGA